MTIGGDDIVLPGPWIAEDLSGAPARADAT
jgi:hypothetical protein